MIRIAIAVLAGYLVMTTMVLLTLQPATMLIDIDRLRDADTGVMTTWFIMVVEWPVAIFTAILGGVVAAVVAGLAQARLRLRSMASSTGHNSGITDEERRAAVAVLFDRVDADGSGFVDVPEFQVMLRELGHKRLDAPHVAAMMRRTKLNGGQGTTAMSDKVADVARNCLVPSLSPPPCRAASPTPARIRVWYGCRPSRRGPRSCR